MSNIRKNKISALLLVSGIIGLCLVVSALLAESDGGGGTPTIPAETRAVETFSMSLTETAEYFISPTVTPTSTDTPTATFTASPTDTPTQTASPTPTDTRTPVSGDKKKVP